MLLSRFWYGLLACLLGSAVVLLYLAQSIHNRAQARTINEQLNADRQVASWYLRGEARENSSLLLKFALDDAIIAAVTQSTNAPEQVPKKAERQVLEGLAKIKSQLPAGTGFDAIFAVDQHGRVVGQVGFEEVANRPDFDLGGYAVVADALRGYVRDDTLLMKKLYRVVARPIVHTAGFEPAGAIVGATLIDSRFAQELSDKIQAAVTFYYDGERQEAGVPPGFSKGLFDQINLDLAQLGGDEAYAAQGSTQVRWPSKSFAVIYSKLPGEAWQLGAGFAVGRELKPLTSPLGWWSLKDETDKQAVATWAIALIVLISLGVGLGLSWMEHNRPINAFAWEASRLAKGEVLELLPSKFRGRFRQIASDINDGVDHVAAKGGHERRPADLQQVLGDLPSQPQMSAFSFATSETAGAAASPPAAAQPSSNAQVAPATAEPSTEGERKPPVPKPPVPKPRGGPARSEAKGAPAAVDSEQEWHQVFEEFVRLKEQCGENTQGLNYERFRQTLLKNQATIMQAHQVDRVRFSVYIKEGKTALKANPVRD